MVAGSIPGTTVAPLLLYLFIYLFNAFAKGYLFAKEMKVMLLKSTITRAVSQPERFLGTSR